MTSPESRAVDMRVIERRAALALAGRETRRVLSLWSQTILPPVVTGAIFLAVFGGALGDRLDAASDIPYVQFILPGLLVMTVAVQSFANNSTSLFQAKNEGYIEDVLTSPMRNWQLVAAYMTGGLLRGWLAAAVLAALTVPFLDDVPNPGVAVLALLLTGIVFSALGVITGMWADTFDQHAFIANILITPLALFGGVFYSAERLEQPWASLTRIDPLYYLVDATRQGITGLNDASATAALLVTAVVGAATYAVAVGLLSRGWRLKP